MKDIAIQQPVSAIKSGLCLNKLFLYKTAKEIDKGMNINSLDSFLEAQDRMYPVALKELKNGKKRTHWMWFIFPQLRGLGMSSISRYYGLENFDEAKAYLEHPLLSGRLYELCGELLKHKDKTALEIFGDIDEMKLKSSMTLFALTTEDYTIFDEVLERFFYGQMDESTVRLINK